MAGSGLRRVCVGFAGIPRQPIVVEDKNAPARALLPPPGADGLPQLPAAAAVLAIAPAAAAGAVPARPRERDGGGALSGEIRDLHQLHQDGILTAAEFSDAKKAAIAKHNAADR